MLMAKSTKAAPRLVSLGMLFLALALAWPRFIHLGAGLGADWTDGIRGLFFGLSIGLNLCAVIVNARGRRLGVS